MATVVGMTAAAITALTDALTAALDLKADLVSGIVPDTELPSNLTRFDSLVINVDDHGAHGDGTTDDTTLIQGLLNSAPAGSVVYCPRSYATISPLTIPPQVGIRGRHGAHIDQLVNPTFKPKSTFTGAAVIYLVDQTTGGYSHVSNEQRIENLTIDCSNLSGSTIDGIQAIGYVHGVYITNVGVWHPPAHGLTITSNGSGVPYSWRVERLHVVSPGTIGINSTMTDSAFIDCQVIAAGSHGWYVGGGANTVFIGCKSEWSGVDGFNLGSGTGTGNAPGGPIFIGCTTDRNAHNGVSIPSTANGLAPVTFVGCSFRRDGSASTSAGYAAVNVNGSTQPIVLNACQVLPGTNDDGTGNVSPQYGLSATSAIVQVNGGVWHAASEGIHNGGSNTRLARSPNVIEQTGPASAPVMVVRGLQTYGTNGDSLDVPGNLAGLITPKNHGAIAWSGDPYDTGGAQLTVNGTLYLAKLPVQKEATAIRFWWGITTAGVGPVSGQNFIGIFDSAGNLVATVNVDGRVTSANTVFQETISLAVTPQDYWGAFLFNATTPPTVMRGSGLNGTLLNFNLAVSAARFATNGTGRTALPSPLVPASNANTSASLWCAITP